MIALITQIKILPFKTGGFLLICKIIYSVVICDLISQIFMQLIVELNINAAHLLLH